MPVKHRDRIKKRSRMFIHWKSLLAFGIIFWFLLCAFDLLGGSPHGYVYDNKDYDLLYETFYMEKLKNEEAKQFIPKLQNFGFSLLVWNSVTFLCSVLFCYVVRIFWWILAKSFCEHRNASFISTLAMVSRGYSRSNLNISKIPVKIKPNTNITQGSDSQIKLSKSNLASGDINCFNFIDDRTATDLFEDLQKTTTDLSEEAVASSKSKTLFKSNKTLTAIKDDCGKLETYGDNHQLNKLRQEIVRVQNISLREQTEISRKLNVVNREKKDLIKQLATAQKENRAAKQQIEELAQDKMILLKKLETVNKEVKSNTKTKKHALAKLEELSNNSDNLKQQLEQVTRDKDILESKLKVLQDEYERLQERIILNDNHICISCQENTPERDINTLIDRNIKTEIPKPKQIIKNIDNAVSVSENNVDMKKIQVKIKQLERNLENFNCTKSDINFREADADFTGESDLSLSIDSSQTELKIKEEDGNDSCDFYFPSNASYSSSPRFPYWSSKIGTYVETHTKQSNPVQLLRDNPELSESVQEKLVSDVD